MRFCRQSGGFLWMVVAVMQSMSAQTVTAQNTPNTAEYFTRVIEPILQTHCTACHGQDTQEHNLRVDTYDGLLAGGKSGPVLAPGQPDESLLIAAVRFQDDALKMPPDKKLSAAEIAALEEWVKNGALHPGGSLAASKSDSEIDVEKARQFWSLQPPERPPVPAVQHPEFVESPIDAFIVSVLEEKKLLPNEVADRLTLIRRATFDLTGLPPTPEEIDDYLADQSTRAFETVVDRLLQSPHYGERWARHWLDVVRYADSNGLDENVAHGHAWKYRDYVVDSLNRDKPFDQFLKEQIAGDLLAADQSVSEQKRVELLTATGFLALGPKVLAEADQTKMLMDIIDEQIDTTGKAFLGMTFGCARCHNHKFDPVSQADYYAMVGIFKSTHTMESLKTVARWHENDTATTADREAQRQHQAKLDAAKKRIETLIADTRASLATGTVAEDAFPTEVREQLTALRAEQKQLEQTLPALPTAMGVKEGTPEQARINIRGSHLMLGRTVPRNVPVVLELGTPLSIPETQSGRLQFADWLTDRRNPLTARVMVNRVWRWHFGRGIVASTDNFGHLGERPSNQPLLDWLATEFMESGWSLKALHRRILLSRTWRLSSDDSAAATEIDPANVYHWRAGHRRLEAESIRDAVLAVSGLLDRTPGGSLLHVGNREFLFNHTSKDDTKYDSLRRSLYLPVIRNNIYDGFSLFDCTDGAVPNGDRASSTVASQALYLMNSELFLKASEKLAARLLVDVPEATDERIDRLFRITCGRPATADEVTQVTLALQQLKNNPTLAQVSVDGTPSTAEQAAWAAVVQSVLASSEFVYVQ